MSIKNYEELRSPIWLIGFFTVIYAGVIGSLLAFEVEPLTREIFFSELRERIGQGVFLVYFAIFAAIWTTYFLSKSTWSLLQSRTLRLLLFNTSVNWGSIRDRLRNVDEDDLIIASNLSAEDEEIVATVETQFRDKARSATQNLGMLLAVACLELAQINLLSRDTRTDDPWTKLTLGVATLSSITAFVLFILATDSLDSLFNKFKLSGDRHILVDHFYRASINPRYYGLSLLILSAVMIIGNREPRLGAVSFGIVFSAGYYHWFPRISSDLDAAGESERVRVVVLAVRVLVILAPVVIPMCF